MKIIFLIQKISTKYCWLTAWRWPKVKLLTCHKTIVRAPVEELPSCRVSPATSWPRTQPRWQTQGSGFCDGEITFVMGYFLLLQKGCNCHNSHYQLSCDSHSEEFDWHHHGRLPAAGRPESDWCWDAVSSAASVLRVLTRHRHLCSGLRTAAELRAAADQGSRLRRPAPGRARAANWAVMGVRRWRCLGWLLELQTKVREDFAHTRAFSWLKAPTSAFTGIYTW